MFGSFCKGASFVGANLRNADLEASPPPCKLKNSLFLSSPLSFNGSPFPPHFFFLSLSLSLKTTAQKTITVRGFRGRRPHRRDPRGGPDDKRAAEQSEVDQGKRLDRRHSQKRHQCDSLQDRGGPEPGDRGEHEGEPELPRVEGLERGREKEEREKGRKRVDFFFLSFGCKPKGKKFFL